MLYMFIEGDAAIGTGDSTTTGGGNNLFRYNRYMHRPFKIYTLTETGSGIPSFPYAEYLPTDRQEIGWTGLGNPSSTDGSQLNIIGNAFSGSPAVLLDPTTPVSGTFEVYSSVREVQAWVLTQYNKLTYPPVDGATFSISQSDGTPVASLAQQRTTLVNPGPVQVLLSPGSYQYTSSTFDTTTTPSGLAIGYSAFGLKTNYGDYVSFQYCINANETNAIQLFYTNTNQDEVILNIPADTDPSIRGKCFTVQAAIDPGLLFGGNGFSITPTIVQNFVAGVQPVGNFSTKIDKIFIQFSSSLSASEAGTYTFDSVPSENLSVTASATLSSFSGSAFDATVYGSGIYGTSTYGAGAGTGGGPTWTTASLKLYFKSSSQASPGSVIQTNEWYSDTFGTTGAEIFLSKSIEYTDPTGNGVAINVNDRLSLSLTVDNGDHTGYNISSSLIVTEYSMSITSSTLGDPGPVPTIFSDLSDFSRAFDCQPLLNNYQNDRLNSVVMEVDYSTNIMTPVNFSQIVSFSASRAAIPDSFYSSKANTIPRYLGSRLDSARINYYTPE